MIPDPDFLYAPEAIELLPWADKLPRRDSVPKAVDLSGPHSDTYQPDNETRQ